MLNQKSFLLKGMNGKIPDFKTISETWNLPLIKKKKEMGVYRKDKKKLRFFLLQSSNFT